MTNKIQMTVLLTQLLLCIHTQTDVKFLVYNFCCLSFSLFNPVINVIFGSYITPARDMPLVWKHVCSMTSSLNGKQ